jgi:chemotaxis protein CheX
MPAIEQTLVQVTQEVLETMAFAMVMPEQGPLPDDAVMLTATVRFHGPFSGCVGLTVAQSALPEIAANMLGLDEPSDDVAQQADALGELTNVLTGNALVALAGPEKVFDLGKPNTTEDPTEALTPPEQGTARTGYFMLDDSMASVTLVLDSADVIDTFEGA